MAELNAIRYPYNCNLWTQAAKQQPSGAIKRTWDIDSNDVMVAVLDAKQTPEAWQPQYVEGLTLLLRLREPVTTRDRLEFLATYEGIYDVTQVLSEPNAFGEVTSYIALVSKTEARVNSEGKMT